MILHLILILCPAQDPSLERLIDQFSSDEIEKRDAASDMILERWQVWTEADLKRLKEAGVRGATPEAAARAMEALETMAVNLPLLL